MSLYYGSGKIVTGKELDNIVYLGLTAFTLHATPAILGRNFLAY